MTPLPRLLVLTDRNACTAGLSEVVAAAVDGGARAVVLRERDLPPRARAALADQLRSLLEPVGGTLVVAGADLPSDAVHLAGRDAFPTPRPWLVGRSCHDAEEVARAAEEGCDWVTISPVHLTGSKPGYGPALGEDGLRRLAAGAPPTYALGGITTENAFSARASGAYGVAVMGAVMRASDPARYVRRLLEAVAA